MKLPLFATIALALISTSGRAEQRPIGQGVDALYSTWLKTDVACQRPGPWTPSKSAVCDRWEKAMDDLRRRGWCYAGTAAREPWHICNAADRRAQASADESVAYGAELDRREALAIRAMTPADRILYRRWNALYGPCSDYAKKAVCGDLERAGTLLNRHGWCRYSPISAVEERWHRCRPGDID